jgi:hypothetical protein
MEYWSGGDLEQALGGEPLLTFPNPSHDRADRRGAAAGLVSGRLPGMTQSAVLPYSIPNPRMRVQFREGALIGLTRLFCKQQGTSTIPTPPPCNRAPFDYTPRHYGRL